MGTPPPEEASPTPLIAPALSAWMGALSACDSEVDFDTASENCVALCRVFTMFAPHLLSNKDFFIPAKNTGAAASRQRRYNTRRLARCLAEWFGLRSRSNSPVADVAPPDDGGAVLELPDAARVRIKAVTDAARAEGSDCDSASLRLALAECLLCAALNSAQKKRFVEAILSLDPQHQDALAVSINRTTSPESEPADIFANALVLAEVRGPNCENDPPAMRSSPSSSAKLAKPHPVEVMARGIPPVEFKAMAEERDALRKKLAAAEAERLSALEFADTVKRDLDDTCDRLRGMQGKVADVEKELENRDTALSDAKAALRAVNQSAEELDLLRAKASSAEQLEASLKRASKRLEEVSDMRKIIKELEAQNAVYRDKEEQMAKQLEFMGSQLVSSNERAQSLVQVSDELSSQIEAKTGEVRDITSKNQELQQKLKTANDQLAQILMNPGGADRDGEVTNAPNSPQELDMELISKRLFDEVGVHMSWDDIVDCIRGVVEAMTEMDEMQRQQDVANNGHRSETSMDYADERSMDMAQPQVMDARSESPEPEDETTRDSPQVKVLPEFALVDLKHETERGDVGDQFDYAVDHPNIREIPVINRRSSGLSTVPEDREGFEDEQDDDVPEPVAVQEDAAAEVRDVSSDYPITTNFDEYSAHAHDLQTVPIRSAPKTTPVSSVTHTVNSGGNMSLSVRPGVTVPVVRHTRSDVPMQNAMDALRMEQSAQSLAVLMTQLTEVRTESELHKAALAAKEREVATLRHDLDSLIKEHDAALNERRDARLRDSEVMREKERVIALLERNLATRDEELTRLRASAGEARAATAELRALELQMASTTHQYTTAARAHEIEIARLGAKLEASELIADKLGAAMDKTDGLSEEIHKARETYFQEMTDAARREKEAAELARAEAQRIADMHQRALNEVRDQQQQQAVTQRAPSVCCSDTNRKPRRARIGAFWRRMLHLDAAAAAADEAGENGGDTNTVTAASVQQDMIASSVAGSGQTAAVVNE